MDLLKQLAANEVMAQIISFLMLLFLLRALAWKKILKLLDERKEKIASEFKRIEDDLASAALTRSEYEAKLKHIDETAKVKIQEAVFEGQKLKEEIKSSARAEADKIVANARVQAKTELLKAKEELKDDVVDLVLEATEHLLEEKMDDEEDRRIVKTFLEEIDKS